MANQEKKTKTYTFGIEWRMYGHQHIEVPEDFTEEQAQEYVREHWDEIPLPDGDYLPESDIPDFEVGEFS